MRDRVPPATIFGLVVEVLVTFIDGSLEHRCWLLGYDGGE